MSSGRPRIGPFWSRWAKGEWEPSTHEWVRQLAPGELLVDIGAWVGPVTLWGWQQGARVIAIEPDPVACVELRRRLAESPLSGEAEVWEGAVVTEPGERAYLTPNPSGRLGDSMSRLSMHASDACEVPAWTLPEILDGRVPRLCKIDVEGYETRLAPVLVPWLLAQGCGVQVSCHGELPALTGGVFHRETRSARKRSPGWGDWRFTP